VRVVNFKIKAVRHQ
jgi:hypothetical protein